MKKKENFFIVLSSFHLVTLRKIVEKVERASQIEILRHPRTTRARAEEITHFNPFSRGPIFITRCAVSVDGIMGNGVIIGDSWEKAYCFAVIDAALSSNHRLAPEIEKIISQQEAFLAAGYRCNEHQSIIDAVSITADIITAVS